jgi:hypothetical protein
MNMNVVFRKENSLRNNYFTIFITKDIIICCQGSKVITILCCVVLSINILFVTSCEKFTRVTKNKGM